jgi:hypothetical protein
MLWTAVWPKQEPADDSNGKNRERDDAADARP